MSSRLTCSTAMEFYDAQNFFCRIPKETLKCFAYTEELEFCSLDLQLEDVGS